MSKKPYAKIAIVGVVMIVVAIRLYVTTRVISINSDNLVGELQPKRIFYLDEVGLGNFTCTGLTYDSNNHTFWIADYGALSREDSRSPRLIEIDEELLNVLTVIDISDNVGDSANVQGIAYDELNDTLRIATGDTISEIDKNGNLRSSINLDDFKRNASNGLCFDQNENLWCLCYTKYLLEFSHDGELLNKYSMNYKDQDHIFYYNGRILASVGADYNGQNNYIMEFTLDKSEDYVLYRLCDSYAVEGICIKDGLLYVANDGCYHDAKIKRSYISIYDLESITN